MRRPTRAASRSAMRCVMCLAVCAVASAAESASTSASETTTPAEVAGKRVCVVGAGVAGLTAAQQLLAAGVAVTVLEASAHVGGTWRYDPRVGLDEYGLPIHTSMYTNLRSNVPKQLMELPDFPLPPGPTFINASDYYNYLLDYADYFHLYDHIKLLHQVLMVGRADERWRVHYRSVATGQVLVDSFDYLLVCVGHYSKPRLPRVPGEKLFEGSIIHSHDYRFPEPYNGSRVLVIGGGPSALDMVTILTRHCEKVIHSHHSRSIRTPFPANYVGKPDVVQFTERGVLFKDSTYEDIDHVIYATGYDLNINFLDGSTGLIPKRSSITPLYRSLVNIQHPSMMLLGLVYHACAIVTIVTQARYATAVISGRAKQPSQHDMIADWSIKANDVIRNHRKPSEIHSIYPGPENVQYYNNLTSEANITAVPPVLPGMCQRDEQAKNENFYSFRYHEYVVLDDTHFTREPSGGGVRECWEVTSWTNTCPT